MANVANAVDLSCLTPVEREILRLIGQGFRDWQIAEGFWMTRQMLQRHLLNILDKLSVADQKELAELAQRHVL